MDEIKPSGVLEVSPATVNYLNTLRKWTKFFAILGYIGIGIMLLTALFIPTFFSFYGNFVKPHHIPPFIFSIVYFILSVVYFFPVTYLNRFSNEMHDAIIHKTSSGLESAFKNLSAHFKFNGILIIVVFGLYFLGIIGAIVFFAAGAIMG